MWASRKPVPADGPRRRHIWLRLLLFLIVALLALYVLPAPWAFHMGGKFSPLGEWDGYGPVQASNGGHYLLYTHLRGGILNAHGHAGCHFTGCNTLIGSAQLCAQGGQHYTFELTGAVHGWYTTNGSRTSIALAGGTPKRLPGGRVVAFHGTWHGPVLPIADTGNSFSEVFTPAGAIRATTSTAGSGTTRGTLRYGSAASFDHACRVLAGQAH
jgi:hypothetical protein